MSELAASATPASDDRTACGAWCGASRPVAGLLRPYRALFAGGVVTNLLVHLFTFGAAIVGAVLVGKALDGAPASELKPLVWLRDRARAYRSPCSDGSRSSSST